MKTFFNITIEGLGDTQTFRVQSTKLRKFNENAKYGFYRLKQKLQIDYYYVSIVLALTYSVELGGTIGNPIKQRRYNIHQMHHEVYTLNKAGMYVNQPPTLCSASVELEEENVMPCFCTLSIENR